MSFAQTTQQVITKTIEKSFAYKKGYEVNIEGEKAEVTINTWDKAEVSVHMEIIAKHPKKDIAERDIEKVKYLTQRIKNKIYLRNYASIEAGETAIEASLSAKYTIYLPKDCPVYLKNYFGTATVSNLNNRLRINGQFSTIGLENIEGFIDVTTRFGDLLAQHLNGQMKINARRSDITLSDIKGSYDIQAQYGVIKIFSDDDLVDLRIDAEKSDVFLYNPNPALFSYALTANHGNISLPNTLKADLKENTPDIKKVEFRPRQELYPSITISVTFGNISVEKPKAR
ncbi:MAG: hypothetical protein DHS20C18_15570 [Saprospiraceae bacterium]|nr:MAG: hypothetical protein DHS20C18_15570 [Saprospiraceae bacterium]